MAEQADRALEQLENLEKAFAEMAGTVDSFKGNLSRLSSRELKEYKETIEKLRKLEDERQKNGKLSDEQEKNRQRLREQLFGKNSKVMDESTEKLGKLGQGFNNALGAITSMNRSVMATTATVYSSKDAFQAFQAPLNLLGDLFKKIFDIGGSVFSGVPIIGGLSDAARKVAGTSIDIAQTIVQNQMQMASQLAQSFKSVSDSGLTFGGNLDSFALAAKNSGVTMQQFGEFVSKNRDNLFALGGSIADNAIKFTQLGRRIGDTNAGLLASYGSYEALNEGIMEYADLQRRLGREEFLRGDRLAQGAEEYLVRQRELSQLTGKSAQALKDEETKRRQALDYQLKLSRMSEEQQRNTQEAMGLAGRLFGTQGQKFLEEYIATGGKIVTKEAITFQAMQKEAADAILAMNAQTGKSREEFRGAVSEEIASRKQSLMNFAKSQEYLVEINRAANNGVITALGETASGLIANEKFMSDGTKMFVQMEKDRLEGSGDSSSAVADAQKKLIETQREIDGIAKDSLKRMSTFVTLGAEVQKRVNALAETSTKLLMVLAGEETMSKEDLLNLANKLMGNSSNGGVSGASNNISRRGRRSNNADSDENRGFWSRLLSSESQESSMARENMGRGDTAQDVKNIFDNVREFLRPKAADEVTPSSNNLESNQIPSPGATAPSTITTQSDPKQLAYSEQMLREYRNQTAMLEKLVRHMA